jgi:HD superfamily phosphohydrolase
MDRSLKNPALPSNLEGISAFDPIHGVVDLRDAGRDGAGLIAALLNSPMLQRLRRIKQLGHVSQVYTGADHTRYAHAVGTMYVMRSILYRIRSAGGFQEELLGSLRKCFPAAFEDRSEKPATIVTQHMLVAALLQDVGELPYNHATQSLLRPNDQLRTDLRNLVGFDVSQWKDKQVFTVASIYHAENREFLRGVDLGFLAYLISGVLPPQHTEETLRCRSLIHMLDGTVDADRLDYVYRDMLHSLGVVGSPDNVIQSILFYDNDGPVFSDPGPLTYFLLMRAHVWSTIYFSPAHRFHTVLLATALRAILKEPHCCQEFFGRGVARGLSLQDFRELDDVSLFSRLGQLRHSKTTEKVLDAKAMRALELLVDGGHSYEYWWLAPPNDASDASIDTSSLALPNDLFFDMFSEFQEYRLYEPATVRVAINEFPNSQTLLHLEECRGPIRAALSQPWLPLPMDKRILLFTPRGARGPAWNFVREAAKDGRLHAAILDNDPFTTHSISSDTRNDPSFSGPAIFISYCFDDQRQVIRIAEELYTRKQRYFYLGGAFQGVGGTAAQNSLQAVHEAEAFLIVASASYAARLQEQPNGNLAKEVGEIGHRVRTTSLATVPITLDEHHSVVSRFPWAQFGFESLPFLGAPLRDAGEADIRDVVTHVLHRIRSSAT